MPLPEWASKVHHDGSEVYISNPLPELNEIIAVSFRAPANAPIDRAFIRAMLDGEFHHAPMERAVHTDTIQIWTGQLPIQQPRIDYRFKLMTEDGAFYYSAAGVMRADTPDSDSFVIVGGYHAPLWVRESVFYQIFPDRFYNGDPSNDVQDNEYIGRGKPSIKRQWDEKPYPWTKAGSMDFFGGDLQGITQKLDYIQELGANALYLCPIFLAETNHKYDVLDYFTVDPHFGGNEALADLRQETEKRDIRLMLDITSNHISYNHPWFTAATADNGAKTAEYFFYNKKTKSYDTWLGVPLLIKLNYTSQKLRDIMYRAKDSAIRHWLKPPYNINAWRLDVANMTGNHGKEQLDHEVWRELRAAAKSENAEVYLLGEYFQDSTMHIQGDELDASMNYQGFNMPIRRWLGGEDLAGHDKQPYADTIRLSTEALAQQWQRFMAAVPYPLALQQFNQLDSHDTTRFLHIVNGDKALLKLALALLTGFPGVPCIYYGTEIGMTGGKDPDNRRTMLWDESDWDTDLRDYTKKLVEARLNSHAMKHGGFQILYAQGGLIAYLRESLEQTLIIVGYRGKKKQKKIRIEVASSGLADGTALIDWLSDETITIKKGHLTIPKIKHGQALMLEVQR